MTEVWQAVKGWPAYEVSNLGRVRSVDRVAPNGRGRVYSVPGRMLNPRVGHDGYLVVTLRGGKTVRSTSTVHRLITEAIIRSGVTLVDRKPSEPVTAATFMGVEVIVDPGMPPGFAAVIADGEIVNILDLRAQPEEPRE